MQPGSFRIDVRLGTGLDICLAALVAMAIGRGTW